MHNNRIEDNNPHSKEVSGKASESALNSDFDNAVEKEMKAEIKESDAGAKAEALSEKKAEKAFLHRLRRLSSKPVSPLLSAITWIVRIAVGGTFVFSGIVKCIDVWGTVYKMYDYIAALGIDWFDALAVPAAFGLCMLELMVGVFLIMGCFRRVTPWILALIMVVMLPLTLWIAVADPVADCGCFGDAFVISNWATFWKNIALTVGVLWLIFFNRRVGWLIRPYLQWIAVVATGLFAGFVEWIGYYQQPLIDFRPYPVGDVIYDGGADDEACPEYVFVYEKDGVEKEYSAEDVLPDEADGWAFVERREVNVKGAESGSGKDKGLAIWNPDDDTDVTSKLLGAGGRQILVLFPDLSDASISSSYTLNSMYSWASERSIDMEAVLAATPQQLADWSELWMPSYPLWRAEDTSLKEVARGNPSVVYLVDGKVIWKRSLASLPVEDFMSDDVPDSPDAFDFDGKMLMTDVTAIYIAVLGVLILFSFLPAIFSGLRRIGSK